MMTKQKELNLLGLAQRASKLVSGDERVEKAVKNLQVHLVIVASDTSSKTQDRYQALAKKAGIPVCNQLTSHEISQALGKSRRICGITDSGMAKTFLSYGTGVKTMKE